jgi:hypothetical protein
MSRNLVTPLAMLAAIAFAASAGAHEYRYFSGSDRVYYQRYDRELEQVQDPHFHLAIAERAFAKGHLSYAADNLEKAAAGFHYFSDRAAGEDRRQLDLAKLALEKLAREVRRGDIDELTTVERALSDARRVLAGEAVMVTPAAPPAAPPQS